MDAINAMVKLAVATKMQGLLRPNVHRSTVEDMLVAAAIHGWAEAVRMLLLTKGVDIHQASVKGDILVNAAKHGWADVVQRLLDMGAEVDHHDMVLATNNLYPDMS
jgi:hypothetical protein